MVEASFWHLLAAGAATLAIGFVWYHPGVFGGAWARLANVQPETERATGPLTRSATIALLAGMLVAFVMNYFGMAWGVFDWLGGLELAFWCWIGFVVPTSLNTVLWEQRPFKLYLINSAYWLVSFIAIALILLF